MLVLIPLAFLFADAGPRFQFPEKSRSNARARASSVLIEKNKRRSFYGAHRAVDRKISTAWCTGKNNGVGESLRVRFEEVQANAVYIFNGYGASRRLYEANNRIKDVDITLLRCNGRKQTIRRRLPRNLCFGDTSRCGDLDKKCIKRAQRFCRLRDGESGLPEHEVQHIPPGCITGVVLRIRSVYPGRKYKDTCIAEVSPIRDGAL